MVLNRLNTKDMCWWQISDKDMSLLEERIKRAAKNRPVASVKPVQQIMAPRPSVAPTPAPAPAPVYDEPESEEEEPLPVIPQIQRYTNNEF